MPDAERTPSDSTPAAVLAVTRNDEASRYEIHVDGVLGGFSEYVIDADTTDAADTAGAPGARVVFPHTEIDPTFSGRGLGSELVGEAMTDAAARGWTVVPECPFVARYLARHDVPGLEIEEPERTEKPEGEDSGSGEESPG